MILNYCAYIAISLSKEKFNILIHIRAWEFWNLLYLQEFFLGIYSFIRYWYWYWYI